MKKMMMTALAVVCMLCACSNESEDVKETSKEKQVKFLVSGMMIDVTRAALTDESLTDLWVLDDGVTVAHQVSTDDDFGEIALNLQYGEHKLSFVASRSTSMSLLDGVLSAGRVKPTFGYVTTLTVDANTNTQQINLNRVVAQLKLTIEDALPTNAKKIEILMDKHYTELNCQTLYGIASAEYSATTAIPDSYAGATGVTTSMWSFCPNAEEWTSDVTITVKDADGNVVTEHTTENVPLLLNRVTNIHGSLFSTNNGAKIMLNTDWETQKDVDL